MKKIKKLILSCLIAGLVLFPQISLAQEGLQKAFGGEGSPLETVRSGAGFSKEATLGTISGQFINVALSLVGLIFLLLMVYSGFLWMTARGEEEQIKKATGIIKGTIIGLVLVLSAYAITFLVTNYLNK